jgi:hypothetical protein
MAEKKRPFGEKWTDVVMREKQVRLSNCGLVIDVDMENPNRGNEKEKSK